MITKKLYTAALIIGLLFIIALASLRAFLHVFATEYTFMWWISLISLSMIFFLAIYTIIKIILREKVSKLVTISASVLAAFGLVGLALSALGLTLDILGAASQLAPVLILGLLSFIALVSQVRYNLRKTKK